MITIASNIAFLSADKWRNYTAGHIRKKNYDELNSNIDYAIDSLKMLEAIIKDIAEGRLVRNDDWDEATFDSVASNGEAL